MNSDQLETVPGHSGQKRQEGDRGRLEAGSPTTGQTWELTQQDPGDGWLDRSGLGGISETLRAGLGLELLKQESRAEHLRKSGMR